MNSCKQWEDYDKKTSEQAKDKQKDSVQSTQLRSFDVTKSELETSYPIGWSTQFLQDIEADHSPLHRKSWLKGLGMLAGWTITAVATTLGAAFWFDLLNKLVSLRVSLKPPEESKKKENTPGEADRKTA